MDLINNDKKSKKKKFKKFKIFQKLRLKRPPKNNKEEFYLSKKENKSKNNSKNGEHYCICF